MWGGPLRNPYLKRRRLPELIAAIQILGAYKYYRQPVEMWAWRISGSRKASRRFARLFHEHPEFFQFTKSQLGPQVGLIARRALPRRFAVDHGVEVAPEAALEAEAGADPRLSRRPLTVDEMGVLVQVAVEMHARAAERARGRLWWAPLFAAAIGALCGGLAAAALAPAWLDRLREVLGAI